MVYLIHFEEKLHHAQHYIGYCDEDLDQRFKRHKAGNGARILNACNKRGIEYYVVRIWPEGDRTMERKLKKRKNSKFLCPICSQKF